MIGIISEYKYSKEELKKLKGKAAINYMLLPQFYTSYAQEIQRINSKLIRRMPGIVFRIEEYYAATQKAIEYALYLKKPIRVITPSGTYYLKTYDDWNQHPVRQEFKEARQAYFDQLEINKLKEQYEKAAEDIEQTPEEVERFVRAFAPLYKVDVNYKDTIELNTVYKQLKYYYNNSIPYGLDHNEIYTVGKIEPDDTPYFTEEMFDYTGYEFEDYDEEYFGDLNYMEDYMYKGGQYVRS